MSSGTWQSVEVHGQRLKITVETCWTDRFAVWIVDSGGPKEAQVQSYSSGGANVPSWEGTLAPPGEYDWTVRLLRRCGLMSNYFDHLLLFSTKPDTHCSFQCVHFSGDVPSAAECGLSVGVVAGVLFII